MRFPDFIRGAAALVRSLDANLVSESTSRERATICANCAWLRVNGDVISRVTAWVFEAVRPPTMERKSEPWTSGKSWQCGFCRCSLRLKLRLSQRFIDQNTSDEMAERAPLNCWWRRNPRPIRLASGALWGE